MGYNEGMEQFGFREEADEAHDLFRSGERKEAAAAISDEMIDTMAVYGTPEDVREKYREYLDAGVDVPVAMPPWSCDKEEIEFVVEALEPLTEE